MNAEILAVGTEILLGDIVNTNAQYLSKELSSLGINVFFHTVVGDNENRLETALELAFSRSEIVITTGGLGPTYDDITKETAAKLLNIPLELNEQVLNTIKNYFSKAGKEMTVSNNKQAYFPQGATILYNECGTAPGFFIKKDNNILIMLPGPPNEMKSMFSLSAKPLLQKLSDGILVSCEVRLFGIGEASAEEKIAHLTKSKNPTLAPYAKQGEVLLRITAKANTKQQAIFLNDSMLQKVKKSVGKYIYGVNVSSLQEVLVDLLKEKKLKIAVAESCTAGLLAKRITEISGASQVFECGVVAYANSIKQSILKVNATTIKKYGAVSQQVAIQMAKGVKELANSDIGIGITGIAGPNGGTEEKPVGLVYVAIHSQNNTILVRNLLLGRGANDREYIRFVATSNALDMAIKELKNYN